MDPLVVLLVRPPASTGGAFRRVGGIVTPLNLLYLAGYLCRSMPSRGVNVAVHVLDLELHPLQPNALRRLVEDMKPRVVGFTAHTSNMPVVSLLSRVVKRACPDALVIAGGPHPTVMAKETLETIPTIDLVVHGEGEETLADVVAGIAAGKTDHSSIKGLSYRPARGEVGYTGKRPLIKDFSHVIPPDSSVLDVSEYMNLPQAPGIWKRTANVFTQRGCPFGCEFCASPIIHDQQARPFPIHVIIDEIEYMVKKHHVTHVTFRDSNFTLDRKRCIQLCKALVERRLGVTWNCETRVNLVSPALLRLMRAAGCVKISFGVESGSPRILAKASKGIAPAQVVRAFSSCKNAGIQTQAYVMVGFPEETNVDVGKTMALIKRIQPDFLFVSILVPLPGTRIREQFESLGLIEHQPDLQRFQFFSGVPAWRTLHFTMDQLVELQRRVYASYVFRPGYVLKMVRQLKEFSQMKYYLVALIDFIQYMIKRRKDKVLRR